MVPEICEFLHKAMGTYLHSLLYKVYLWNVMLLITLYERYGLQGIL
jgi:hypothetical protein